MTNPLYGRNCILIPKPLLPPVFDHYQYQKKKKDWKVSSHVVMSCNIRDRREIHRRWCLTIICHEKSAQYQESVKQGIRHTHISLLHILCGARVLHTWGDDCFFRKNWERITNDGWILQMVTGCTLEFKSKLPLGLLL